MVSNPNILARHKKDASASRSSVMIETLESPVYPHVFRFLGISDGSEAVRLTRGYRGNIVNLIRLALNRWLSSKAVVHLKNQQGLSIPGFRTTPDKEMSLSAGFHFLEINGVRAALSISSRMIGFPDLNLSFILRADDAVKLKGVFEEIEQTLSQLNGLVLDGECNASTSFGRIADSDVVLNEETRRVLHSNTVGLLGKADMYKRLGIPLKRGILLWGSPGCGKTMCAKMLMSQFPRAIYVTASDFAEFSDWGIPDIYAAARRLAPCLVVLEDLDVIGGLDRSHQSGKPLGQLLAELDGLESNQGIITVATTNDVGVLDAALKSRPGRFDLKLHFQNPDHVLRLQLLKLFTQGLRMAPDVDLNVLSNRMEYGSLSCAHVREVVTRAAIYAADELAAGVDSAPVISQAHLEKALRIMADPKQRKMGFTAERG